MLQIRSQRVDRLVQLLYSVFQLLVFLSQLVCFIRLRGKVVRIRPALVTSTNVLLDVLR